MNLTSLPIANFDAFIYTSSFDGMPNIILETMACGLPVVAPDVGGIGEAVVSGKTGHLVSNMADDDALTDAYMDAVLRSLQQLESLIGNG